jgi:hypothetical protein
MYAHIFIIIFCLLSMSNDEKTLAKDAVCNRDIRMNESLINSNRIR